MSSFSNDELFDYDKVLANFTRLGGGLGRRIRPKPPPLGRCGGARVPSGCPLRTSPTVKLIAARRNLVYVIIGSGFGGSVSAMRLTEKGYRVLVLERGKRYRDQDFARTTWNIWKYLWLPAARCFGILQISPFRDVLVLH